jgi:hypothetical protein
MAHHCHNTAHHTSATIAANGQLGAFLAYFDVNLRPMTTPSDAPLPAAATTTGPTWFGHPRPLARLFAIEMWERFGYYGMRALLMLYLTKHFLLGDRVRRGSMADIPRWFT